MGWLTDWVRQIVFFLIFMSLFYQIVPDKKYKSYLKLFASLVLILLTVNPLLQFFDMRQSLEFQQNVFAYPGEVEEFRLKAEQAQGQQYEDILETYRQTVEEQLRGMAEGFGLYARGCEAALSAETESFGQVTGVRMTVSYRRLERGSDREQEGISADSVEKIEEISIPSVQLGALESESGPEPEQPGTDAGQPEPAESQDLLNLREQITRLYQLKPEQVTVVLEE